MKGPGSSLTFALRQLSIDEVWRDGPEDFIPSLLLWCVASIPRKTFMKASGRSLTFAQADSSTNAWAAVWSNFASDLANGTGRQPQTRFERAAGINIKFKVE